MQRAGLHFVLDHNFPYQVVHGLDWPPYIRLSGLKDIAPQLVEEPDDWRILLALAADSGIDGYITNDGEMLNLVEEMAVLTRTQLTLVVTASSGHTPMRASGLLMTYLPEIARQVQGQARRQATIFRLQASQVSHFRSSPGQQIDKLAARRQIEPQRLLSDTLRGLDFLTEPLM
jgi:hypothetical protein